MKRYEALAADIESSIRNGTLKTGDRLPSVRHTGQSRGVSASTVFEAYDPLEARGLVRARDRSGDYVTGGGLRDAPPESTLASRGRALVARRERPGVRHPRSQHVAQGGALRLGLSEPAAVSAGAAGAVHGRQRQVARPVEHGGRPHARQRGAAAADRAAIPGRRHAGAGRRDGWTSAGRFTRKVARQKLSSTLSTSAPAQPALADYLEKGGLDRHLRKLRQTLAMQQATFAQAVGHYFPQGTRATRPLGGYFLWVELRAGANALEIHRKALELGISVAPGPIFSATRAFGNCLLLNYGHPWNEVSEQAMRTLGRLIAEAS